MDPHGSESFPFAPTDNPGRILSGDFSRPLKHRVARYIENLAAFERSELAPIVYLAAWQESREGMWYEFASRQFLRLMHCTPGELPRHFRQSILQRRTFKYREPRTDLAEKLLTSSEIESQRHDLRAATQLNGELEAIYRILSPGIGLVWLKDQARIEHFQGDDVFLSMGTLIDMTKEMEMEEALRHAYERLRNQNDLMTEKVAENSRRLHATQIDIVNRLGMATELRDGPTGRHLRRMTGFARLLGRAAGLEPAEYELYALASTMHDVGKIAIADRILLHPGRLGPKHRAVIMRHAAIGSQILSNSDSRLLQTAETIALTHHEHWDGTGYPQGLKGEEIPLCGRIVGICDVFDALISERPYKPAWPLDKALLEIEAGSGSQFDPWLSDLFLQLEPQLREIIARQN